MFVLAELQDTVRIEPHRFSQDMGQELSDELNKKFANKVVHKVGLCIALHDILHVGDSYIFPSDGASHTKVSLGFFDDIMIPQHSLQHPKRFDDNEQLWVWEYQTDEGTHDMFMDVDEDIRFRVVEQVFVDTSPTDEQPSPGGGAMADSQGNGTAPIPYSIVGSVSESGLGLLSWWNG